MKTLTKVKFISFFLTILTSIPLLISYLRASSSPPSWLVSLHVWIGLVFLISASICMIKEKKLKD